MSLVVGDWGTSRLRLFRMEGGAVAARVDGPGIGAVGGGARDALRTALKQLLPGGAAGRVVLCGMAGARGALVEAPYAPCPAGERDWRGASARTELDGAAVEVAAGLKCRNWNDAADVIRGEETQVFGALHLRPELGEGRRLILHPGTHSKWIALEGGRVTRFHSFPSGELFALLRDKSTLLRAGAETGTAEGGFAAGLERAQGPGSLMAGLFETRAAQLLDGRSAGFATAFLSGLIIGAEVDMARRLIGDVEGVTLVGEPALTALYGQALGATAGPVLDGDACVLAGLARLAA